MTTIDQVLDAFLAEQKERLAERTFGNYLDVIELAPAPTTGRPDSRGLPGFGVSSLAR